MATVLTPTLANHSWSHDLVGRLFRPLMPALPTFMAVRKTPFLNIGAEQSQQPCHHPKFQEWILPDGRLWTEFYRVERGYLIRFPDFADYEIDSQGTVARCFPVPGVAVQTLWHLFHNQVLPLALSHQGNLVFHGSAVEVGQGAIAFLGASGKGKSTLAASFASNGFPFLTDDGLLLESSSAAGWLAMPSQPSIRLWEDSQHALVGADAPAAPPLEFTSKGRFLSNEMLVHSDQPKTLKCIYFLGDGSAAHSTFERLSLSSALIELVKHSFLLDIDERQMLATHFGELSALVAEVPCVRLDYPRSFGSLDRLRARVLDDLKNRDTA